MAYINRVLIPNGLAVASRITGQTTVKTATPTGLVLPVTGSLPPDLAIGDYVYDATTPAAITAAVTVAAFTPSSVTLNTTLASGALLGDILYFARPNSPVNLGDRVLYGVQMDPNGWTAAGLSFRGTVDNIVFGDMFDDAGNEMQIQAPAAGRVIFITNPDRFVAMKRLIVRSGLTAVPVNQGATRVLTLITGLRWAD